MKDLTQSKTDLQKYTLKHVMLLIPLIENHFSELIAIGEYADDPEKFDEVWEKAEFCIECLPRHGGEMAGYSLECIRGYCSPESGWRDLHNFGSEIYDFFNEHTKKEDYTKEVFAQCQEFVSKLRQIRKKLTGEVISMDHITDEDHIVDKSGIGIGGEPRRGKPKTEKERKAEHIRQYGEEKLPPRGTGIAKLDGKLILMIDLEKWETVPGGLVRNEEKALATPCHGYDLGEGKKMLWSLGVIGTLSLPEQEKFCKVGVEIEPATGPLARRIKALREAGVTFK